MDTELNIFCPCVHGTAVEIGLNGGKKHKMAKKDNGVKEDKVKEEETKKPSKAEEKLEEIRKVREDEKELLRSVVESGKNYQDVVSDTYTEMDSYIDMVALGVSYGCVIEGKGGLGKTYRTMTRLNRHNVDVAYLDSFSTPVALYGWMYKNKNSDVMVLDDLAGLTKDPRILAYLKGALWTVNDKRLVHNLSMKPPVDEYGKPIPDWFEITARMIILTNKWDTKNPHVKAVNTRINYAVVEMSYDEIMKIIEQVMKKPYGSLSIGERKEVFDYLKTHTSESTENLNIRTLIKMFQFKEFSNRIKEPDKWKQLSLKSLKKDDLLLLVEKLVKDNVNFPKDSDKEKEFIKLTGKSRASWFRLKKQLELQGSE